MGYKRTLGENIYYYRKRKDVSQKELAESINMSPQNLSRIEKGIVKPTSETLEKIINALNVSPNQIFGVEQYESVHIQLPFARNFKYHREYIKLSIEETAKTLGIPISDVEAIEDGTLKPSKELIDKICKAFYITEESLTENDIYQRTKTEIEILSLVDKRNHLIEYVNKILEADFHQEVTRINEITGEPEEYVYTGYDQAVDYIINSFKSMKLNQLIELYKMFLDKELNAKINEMLNSKK